MKGYLFIIPLLTVVVFSCDNYNDISPAQSDSFIKNYTPNLTNAGIGVCRLSDGGYALLGNTETVARGTDICLIITDVYGNSIQQAKPIGSSIKNDNGYCIKQAPDGGFIILGSRQDSVREDLDVFLIRTDRLGDTLWTRTYNDKVYNKDDVGRWFDINDNGDIMMVGYTSNPNKHAWHYIVDQNGNQINAYTPIIPGAGSANDEARYVQWTKDGWLVAGILHLFPTQLNPIWLITNDYQFAYRYVSESNANEEANSIAIVDDSTFFVCGTVPDGVGGSDVLLYKANKVFIDEHQFQYERKWARNFGNAGNDEGTCILARDNQIYVLSTNTNDDKTKIISIITTDLQGENPQYGSFGGSSLMESSTFEFTEDGGFIISGTNRRNFKSSLMMIKTKAGGKL
jgi:hypothetical protein